MLPRVLGDLAGDVDVVQVQAGGRRGHRRVGRRRHLSLGVGLVVAGEEGLRERVLLAVPLRLARGLLRVGGRVLAPAVARTHPRFHLSRRHAQEVRVRGRQHSDAFLRPPQLLHQYLDLLVQGLGVVLQLVLPVLLALVLEPGLALQVGQAGRGRDLPQVLGFRVGVLLVELVQDGEVALAELFGAARPGGGIRPRETGAVALMPGEYSFIPFRARGTLFGRPGVRSLLVLHLKLLVKLLAARGCSLGGFGQVLRDEHAREVGERVLPRLRHHLGDALTHFNYDGWMRYDALPGMGTHGRLAFVTWMRHWAWGVCRRWPRPRVGSGGLPTFEISRFTIPLVR